MALLAATATFVAITLALIGWGGLVAYALGIRAGASAQDLSLGDMGLLGLVLLAGAGQLLQFLIPLSSSVAVGFVIGGLAGCVLLRQRVLAGFRGPVVLFMPLVALAYLVQGLTDAPSPDAGVYYIQSILWNTQLPLVPGLGNVQGRLAYNSTEFVLAALFKLPGVEWQSAFLVNAFIALYVLVALFEHLDASLRTSEPMTLVSAYAFVLLLGFCAHHFYVSGSLGSLTTDFPEAMLIPYAVYLVLHAVATGRHAWLIWAVVLASLAVTIKLAALPLLVGLVGILIALSIRTRFVDMHALALAAGGATCLLAPWMLRGLLLSGCLLYPMRLSCITGLPWAVRPELAASEMQYVIDYARGTIAPPANLWDWVAPELIDLAGNHIGRLILLLIAAGALLLAIAPRVGRGRAPANPPASSRSAVAWCASLLVLGIVFSLVVAPALRFSIGDWYALGALALAAGLAANAARFSRQGWGKIVVLALSVLMTLQMGLLVRTWLRTTPVPRVTPVAASPKTTQFGLTVYVPPDEYCEATPLPCTPYFDATLREVSFSFPLGHRFYFQGSNTVAYRNRFPSRE